MINYTLIGWTAICIISMLLVIRFWKVGIVSNSIPVKRLEYYYRLWRLRRTFSKEESMILWSTFAFSFLDMCAAQRVGSCRYSRLVDRYVSDHCALNRAYARYFKKPLRITAVPD